MPATARRRPLHFLAALAATVVLVACQPASVREARAPAGVAPAPTTAGVAAANPYAVAAGLEVLRAGGSAVDAAVAVQAMLGLVEPQSSGIGGGAFLLHYDARSGRITAFDGREAAPAGATPDMFLAPGGEPLGYREAVTSGYSVIIAAAGGAAHLPGMLASVTRLPVIGVPVPITALDGMDALLSIVQMPAGVPVATMAIGGAVNAALMAIRILAVSDDTLAVKLDAHREKLQQKAAEGDAEVRRRSVGD